MNKNFIFVTDPHYDGLAQETPFMALVAMKVCVKNPVLLQTTAVEVAHLWDSFCDRIPADCRNFFDDMTIGVFDGFYVRGARYGITFRGTFRTLKPHELGQINIPMKDWVVPLTFAVLSSHLCKYPIEGVGFTHPLHHELEEYGYHRLIDIRGNNGDFRVLFKDGKGVVLSPCESFSVGFVRPSEFEDALTRVVDYVIKHDMDHRMSCHISAAERSTIEEEMSLTGLYGDRLRLYMKDHPLEAESPPLTLVTIDKDGLYASYLLDAEDAATIPFIVEHAPVIEVQHNGEVVRLKLDGLRLETLDEAKTAAYKVIYGQRVSYSFIQVRGNFELFPLLNNLVFEKTKHLGLTDYSQTWKDQLKDFFSTDYDR